MLNTLFLLHTDNELETRYSQALLKLTTDNAMLTGQVESTDRVVNITRRKRVDTFLMKYDLV